MTEDEHIYCINVADNISSDIEQAVREAFENTDVTSDMRDWILEHLQETHRFWDY